MKIQRDNLRVRNEYKNIYPGRMNSLGQPLQYILAKNLFKNTSYEIGVDCSVRYYHQGEKRQKRCYPDIMVIEKRRSKLILKGLIDIKLDLGWLDTKYYGIVDKKYYRNKNIYRTNLMSFISAKNVTYKIKDDSNEVVGEREVMIPRAGIIKVALLLMKENDHGRYELYKKAMKDAGYEILLVLSEGSVRKPKDQAGINKAILNNMNIENILRPFYKIR